MSTGILNTKLYKPARRSNDVVRPRLFAKLDQGIEQGRRLTLISAPAGSGKTTLLAAWLAERTKAEGGGINSAEAGPSSFILHPPSFAWLSLDEDDNDPARFWTYAIAALQAVRAGLGQTLRQTLQSAQPAPILLLLPDLLNEIADLADPLILVLDDYHAISAAGIHESLAFMLDHAPPSLHLVVATRADPPLPLARLRARDSMVELRAADLRFTTEEAFAFLTQAMGLNVQPGEVEALVGRTEGWAAGLQLAALSLRGQTNLREYIESFTGEHHYVLDYLVEEVLRRQPEPVQRFLAHTSILERLCGPLCDHLLDERPTTKDESRAPLIPHPASRILEHLERSNLFLIPLDDERRWYRYHHLFRDLLRARLERSDPGVTPELHRRASAWFDEHGFPPEAVQHAFAARDYLRAADLIERHIPSRWALGDATFLSMIGKLPIELVQSRPSLAIHHAFALIIVGQHHAAETVLRGMLPHLPAEPNPEVKAIASFATVLLAYIAELMGTAAPAELPDPQSLEHVPEHRLAMRNTADATYAFLLHFRGEFDRAEELLLGAVRRDLAANGTNAIPVAISRLGRVRIVQGRLHDAAALCREYLRRVEERGQRLFYIGGSLNLVLGDVLREWNQLESAEREIRHGVELNEPWPSFEARAIGYFLLARVLLAQANLDGALDALQHVDRMTQGPISPDILSDFQGFQVRLWLAQGNVTAASAWAKQRDSNAPPGYRHERDQITRARVLLAQGQASEAHAVLSRLQRAAEQGGRAGRQIEITLLNALALHALDRRPPALNELERCLALAEPEGYQRIFLDEGEPLQLLIADCRLQIAGAAPRLAAYAEQLLAKLPSKSPIHNPQSQGAAAPSTRLAEPLTSRELQVLRLICEGDSNQAIAEKLVITIGAVKKHTGNIFGKLGVSSRTQAIVRARELALIR
ncbi:MAG: AAA family ATPase [Kouleothrix sp.]|nr:AAA family ATPase [Kouleothrix sp.]